LVENGNLFQELTLSKIRT